MNCMDMIMENELDYPAVGRNKRQTSEECGTFEIDVIELLVNRCKKHRIHETSMRTLFKALEDAASVAGVEPDGLYMILLDCISGDVVMNRKQIVQQFAIALDNNGVKGFELKF